MGCARTKPAECESCAICLEPMAEQHEIVKTNCGHFYHLDCAARAMQHSATCPLCRTTIDELQWAFANHVQQRARELHERKQKKTG